MAKEPSLFTEADIQVRDMRTEDLSDVVHIEQTAHVSPWARLSFEESLNKQYVCRVLEARGTLVAYHVVSAVLDELHILNVVCAPTSQGLGIGHVLMNDIITLAEQRALKQLFLEVRASNLVAQSLYEKWQFKQIAIRKSYYRPATFGDEREDAFVYLRKLH